MDIMQKLVILTDSAKYDAACTSSGANRSSPKGTLGNTVAAGCCHSFSADGRCISLLKVLMTNECIHDCRYCVNRRSNDVQRASFLPEELAEITIQFYRRNYIEGLFLSSGVYRSPDYTMELMIKAIEIIRYRHLFWGYIHAKAIPGASPELVVRLGYLVDRISVNIELPSEESLRRLAPGKTKKSILDPMRRIAGAINESSSDLIAYKNAPRFATGGQATQMIIGASPESDYQIIRLASGLYGKFQLKRVFYSAYLPVMEDNELPSVESHPPLLREHRLYQADFLMRQYGFKADEILSEQYPDFNPYLDPKCNWAVNHMEFFPVDVNTASLEQLLRVPGIGPLSSKRIVTARKNARLASADLKRLGVVMKRAAFFISTADRPDSRISSQSVALALMDPGVFSLGYEQLSFFTQPSTGSTPLPALDRPGLIGENITEAAEIIARKLHT